MAFREIVSNVKVAAALPAAGAFDSPQTLVCNTYQEVTFGLSYTRGAAGGAIGYKVEFSFDGTTWYQVCEFQAAVIVAGADDLVSNQRASLNYQATSGSAETFLSPTFTVCGKFVRISARETGAVGTPGTASIQAYLRGDF